MSAFTNFYRGKTVLVTGHTGFKGGWLAAWLKSLGAQVIGSCESKSFRLRARSIALVAAKLPQDRLRNIGKVSFDAMR